MAWHRRHLKNHLPVRLQNIDNCVHGWKRLKHTAHNKTLAHQAIHNIETKYCIRTLCVCLSLNLSLTHTYRRCVLCLHTTDKNYCYYAVYMPMHSTFAVAVCFKMGFVSRAHCLFLHHSMLQIIIVNCNIRIWAYSVSEQQQLPRIITMFFVLFACLLYVAWHW